MCLFELGVKKGKNITCRIITNTDSYNVSIFEKEMLIPSHIDENTQLDEDTMFIHTNPTYNNFFFLKIALLKIACKNQSRVTIL